MISVGVLSNWNYLAWQSALVLVQTALAQLMAFKESHDRNTSTCVKETQASDSTTTGSKPNK